MISDPPNQTQKTTEKKKNSKILGKGAAAVYDLLAYVTSS